MVKFALHFKAELENITDVGPSSEEYEWHFKVKCNNCKEINKNWVGVNQLASNAISGSRGSANFVMHCKFCKREGYAQFDNTSIKPYTIENTKGVKSNIVFNDIDLTSKEDWADYDEEAGVPVGISEIE
ncbi:16862_t:CDS:2, partial [Cetraspora pellucida]